MPKNNPTLEKYKKNLSENMNSFTEELVTKFPNLRLTSGFRQGAKTKQGNQSKHSLGEAIDIENNKEVYNYLYNTKEGISLLNKYNLGIIDETTPEMMKKTGATGEHYHIGTDSYYVKQAKNRYKELVGTTTELNNLSISTGSVTFEGVPYNQEEDTQKKDEDVEELKQKTAEYNFLKELQNQNIQQPEIEQAQVATAQPVRKDYNQMFEQISQFIDNPVAQQGRIVKENNKINPILNKKTDFSILSKSNLKGLYLDESSDQYRKYKERHKYFNPEKKEVKSGDFQIDFLYKNDFLIDIPIIGDYIKNEAKDIAVNSAGNAIVNIGEKGSYYGDSSDDKQLGRAKLLDQYFSKKDLLPRAKYKPINDYYTFLPTYSIKGNFENRQEDIKTFKNIVNEMSPKKIEDLKKNPIYLKKEEASDLSTMLGADLGGHKIGMAWDKEKNLPYISISDAWDFEPSHYAEKWKKETYNDSNEKLDKNKDKAYIQAYLMHKAGNPYKIYDRFYFDPNTKEYIKDKKQQGGKIDEDRQWLENWYSKRVLPNPSDNEKYQQIKPKLLTNLSNTPDPTYVEEGFFNNPSIKGEYRWDAKNPQLLIEKNVPSTVKLHETTHGITLGGEDDYSGDIEDYVHEQAIKREDIKDSFTQKNYYYVNDLPEVSAKLNVLRKLYNFKPDEVITKEKIEEIRKNRKEQDFNVDQLLNMYTDENLSNVFNKVAYVPKNNYSGYSQQGGEFSDNELAFLSEIAIKDNKGQWTNPGKITQISGNNITMQDVPYPVLGISKETGESVLMKPNKNYNFSSRTKNVIEIPLFKK